MNASIRSVDYARDRIVKRLHLSFTPAEARSFISDLETIAHADALREVSVVIQAELDLVTDPVGPFESGAAAAYHHVLAFLGEALGEVDPEEDEGWPQP